MSEDKLYRPCVGIALFDRAGRVFIGRRAKGDGEVDAAHAWQMPQGGIDPGEDPYQAALRELYEETNIRSVSRLAEAPDWFAYDLPCGPRAPLVERAYRGQTQKWFALRFEGAESEIDITAPGGHAPEFVEWRWESLDRTPDLIVPFKRPVYERVVATFAAFAR